MVLQNVLVVSSPLAGVSYYKMYYGLLESNLFIISVKYISLERSESQDSIFVIDVILREKLIDLWQKCIKKIQWGLDAPGGCFWYNA